jgi:hypothetical protein
MKGRSKVDRKLRKLQSTFQQHYSNATWQANASFVWNIIMKSEGTPPLHQVEQPQHLKLQPSRTIQKNSEGCFWFKRWFFESSARYLGERKTSEMTIFTFEHIVEENTDFLDKLFLRKTQLSTAGQSSLRRAWKTWILKSRKIPESCLEKFKTKKYSTHRTTLLTRVRFT